MRQILTLAGPAPKRRFTHRSRRQPKAYPACPVSADERARAFVDDQVELLRQRNVDGLLERHYHPDALLVTQQVSVRGHIALRAYFTQYVAALGDFEVNSIDLLSATDDAFLFEATVTSSLGRARVYDAFVLRDGRATHHFAGVMG